MWNRDTRRGFTLVEVIITLGLLAIIAAMGAPRLSAALRRRTTQTAADFLGLALDLRINLLQLVIQLCEFGIRRPELGADLRDLNFQVRLRRLQLV